MLTSRLVTALVVVAIVATTAGCGGGEDRSGTTGGPPPAGPVSGRAIAEFELYVQASDQNNPLFADVYGISLEPLGAHRLTSGKRISSMDANADDIAVAAADGDIDRLGYVQGDGAIGPIPGLGRPYAHTPIFDRDGSIFYEDEVGSLDDPVFRYVDWDPRSGKKLVILKTRRDDLFGPIRGPDGRLTYIGGDDRDAELLFMDREGDRESLQLPTGSVNFFWGARWLALTLNAPDSRFGDKPTDLVLLDPDSGERKRVPGLQPITWTPDGSRLLVRTTGDPVNSELALLDPARPDTVEALGTIPDLVIYNGAWVERN